MRATATSSPPFPDPGRNGATTRPPAAPRRRPRSFRAMPNGAWRRSANAHRSAKLSALPMRICRGGGTASDRPSAKFRVCSAFGGVSQVARLLL